jgi:hypothetical protein
MARSVPRGLLGSFAIVLGSSVVLTVTATAGEQVERRGGERWHLSRSLVARGLVSGEEKGVFASANDCLAAREQAVQRNVDELRSRGNDVTRHGATIIETRRSDPMVLTVVEFSCARERDWIILVAQPPSAGAEDRIGPFSTETQCIEALELEVDFKIRALQRLGNDASAVRSTTTDWTLRIRDTSGTAAGHLKTSATYRCVSE